MSKNNIGVGVVTYNSEEYFYSLYNTLPHSQIDQLVVVNGGNTYEREYKHAHWIQHTKNFYPSVCRNDCLTFLLNRDCEHIFLIEDDMLLKNPNIFDAYIKASEASGLKYFSFVSTAWESGTPKNRTPRLTAQYKDGISLSFYKNMCNEFTYHHKSCFELVGLYDGNFRDPFDIDLAYRESSHIYSSPFWWFTDITNSDDYIMNNPDAKSRLQADRPDGSREQRIQKEWAYFKEKHGLYVNEIPDTSREDMLKLLKMLKK